MYLFSNFFVGIAYSALGGSRGLGDFLSDLVFPLFSASPVLFFFSRYHIALSWSKRSGRLSAFFLLSWKLLFFLLFCRGGQRRIAGGAFFWTRTCAQFDLTVLIFAVSRAIKIVLGSLFLGPLPSPSFFPSL